MRHLSRILFILIFSMLIVSCTSSSRIAKNMNSKRYSLAYIQDSDIASIKDSVSLRIDSVVFNATNMKDSTIVKKEKGWFLPLVLVYVWKAQHNCVQGKLMMEEDLSSFCRSSLASEILRSGRFHADTLANAPYTLDVSIDEMMTTGPYVSSGFFYFAFYVYGFSYADNAGPAVSTLRVSYKLKKGNQLVHSNSFFAEKKTEQIVKRYTNINILQQDYAVSMVEACSYNFKRINEQIVTDLNTYFAKQNRFSTVKAISFEKNV